jgi:hypothetical protein
MAIIICNICGEATEVEHGNTIYCNSCKKIVKKQTSSSRYARISMEADPYWLNEKILRKYFGRDMHPDLLESEGFDFEKYREKIIIKGETVFAMKKFAFSILKNKTVRIWKQW